MGELTEGGEVRVGRRIAFLCRQIAVKGGADNNVKRESRDELLHVDEGTLGGGAGGSESHGVRKYNLCSHTQTAMRETPV